MLRKLRRRIRARLRLGRRRTRSRIYRMFRFLFRTAFMILVLICLWVAAYRWINPPITYYMASEWVRTGELAYEWKDLEDISPHLPRAVLGGEDARFCSHYGFDLIEIRKALAEDGRRRGASTLTQQVAKNAFLWPDASWLRKGLEAGFTVLIETFWTKDRIIEVYLNIAELGPSVFGAEAGAKAAFSKSAGDLSLREASRLAAILPNPKGRSASRPSAFVQRRARAIADGAETLRRSGGADCVTPR